MGQSDKKKDITLYAYTITKKYVNLFSSLNISDTLRDIQLSQKTAKERIEVLYKKDDEHPSSSRVIAHMESFPQDSFGVFYVFANVDHNIFLEQEALQKNSFTHRDLKIETDKKDDLGYKTHIYFYIKDDILITSSANYKDLEGHLNYILKENMACTEIALTKKIRSIKNILFSDIKELIFYDWNSDTVDEKLKESYKSSIHKLSEKMISNLLSTLSKPFMLNSVTKRKQFINYKSYLTCEIERNEKTPLSEYKKELGFALRFTEEMKGRVVFKTIHNQRIDGDEVIDKRPVKISFSPETINESELLNKMREYAKEIEDYEEKEKQHDEEGFK